MGLKTLALMAVALCGFLLGLEGKRRLGVRLRSMEMFRGVLREIRVTVAHSGLPLREIISLLADRQQDNRFLEALEENLEKRQFYEAWQQALDRERGSLCLRGEDIELLSRCGGTLCQSDLDGELQALAWAEASLTQAIEDLARRRESDGKLLTALGGAGGAVLALLLW